MTTPYLDEAERCNRVAMMNDGKIISMDTPQNLKTSLSKEVVEIICDNIRKAYQIIKKETEFDVQIFGDRINVGVNNYSDDINKIEMILKKENINIINQRLITPSLEYVFINLIKKAS